VPNLIRLEYQSGNLNAMYDLGKLLIVVGVIYLIGLSANLLLCCLFKQGYKPNDHLTNLIFGLCVTSIGAGISASVQIPFRNLMTGLITVAALCVGLITFNRRKEIKPWNRRHKRASLFFMPLAILVTAFSQHTKVFLNQCDDTGRYFTLATRLWQSGNIADTFNSWRVLVPGGALTIQSLGLLSGSNSGPVLLDIGLGCLLLYFLALKVRQTASKYLLGIVIFCALVTGMSGISQVNSVPRITPLAWMICTLWILFQQSESENKKNYTNYFIIGMSLASIAIIRIQFAPFLLLCTLVFLSRRRIGRIVNTCVLVAGGIIASFPWLIASWKDVRIIVYPITTGFLDPSYLGNELPLGTSNYFIGRLTSSPLFGLNLLLLLFLVLFRKNISDSDERRSIADIKWILFATISSSAVFLLTARVIEPTDAIRYVSPIFLAGLILACLKIAEFLFTPARQAFVWVSTLLVLVATIGSAQLAMRDLPSHTWRAVDRTIQKMLGTQPVEETKGSLQWMLPKLLTDRIDEFEQDVSVLSAISDTSRLISSDAKIYSLGTPGAVYPTPHDMIWKQGLSPVADLFEVQVDTRDLAIGEVWPLVSFGKPGRADMIGLRRAPSGFEVVLDHWGYPIAQSRRLFGELNSVAFRLEIDRSRGLVHVENNNSSSTLLVSSGTFYDKYSEYQIGGNLLGFSTMSNQPSPDVSIRRTVANRDKKQFYKNLITGLNTRGIDFILAQRPDSDSCLYNNLNWRQNAISNGIYESQAPYFFAWFDTVDHVVQYQNAVSVIDQYVLIDVKKLMDEKDF
jgi:hypothetical protein